MVAHRHQDDVMISNVTLFSGMTGPECRLKRLKYIFGIKRARRDSF